MKNINKHSKINSLTFCKLIKSLAMCLVVCLIILGGIIFSGCTQKTYKLVGLVDVENDKIVYYDNLSEKNKAYIDEFGDFTIKLGFRDDFTITTKTTSVQSEYQVETIFTMKGTYEIKDNVLSWSSVDSEGKKHPLPDQQYTNGRIIYCVNANDGTMIYLVFE